MHYEMKLKVWVESWEVLVAILVGR
jgi:hypothetical protein